MDKPFTFEGRDDIPLKDEFAESFRWGVPEFKPPFHLRLFHLKKSVFLNESFSFAKQNVKEGDILIASNYDDKSVFLVLKQMYG